MTTWEEMTSPKQLPSWSHQGSPQDREGPTGQEGLEDLALDRDPQVPRAPTERSLAKRSTYELTPLEIAQRRRNRRWMLALAIPTAVVVAFGTILSVEEATAGHIVHPLSVPAGYQAVTDGYFGYSVPASWKTSPIYSDFAGDLFNGGPGGWAAESLGISKVPPGPKASPPASFASFGEPTPTPYSLSPASKTEVHGASVAWSYTLSRPGGFRAEALDVWRSDSQTQLWLLIKASPTVTARILSTLNA